MNDPKHPEPARTPAPARAAGGRPAPPPRRRVGRIWGRIGPGLITGAADDDPSGIATYAQVGAQYGYAIGWIMLFSYPLMAAMQEISARIGRVTGHGIAGNLRSYYAPTLLRVIVALLLLANTINIGADLGAMGDAMALLVPVPRQLFVVIVAVFCAWLEIFSRYSRYVAILKWTTLVLLAYVAAALVVDLPWDAVLYRTLVPSITADRDYLVAIVAVLGTTISPYMFFWQSSQEAEDERTAPDEQPLIEAPDQAMAQIGRIRLDTYLGMGYSNVVSLFIILTTAATLHANGITNIQTSTQAALALRPLAGDLAFALFAVGIVGTGLLAVPVLAGSAAYAVGEALQWPVGLARRPLEAKAFYGTIAFATLIGIGINFIDIDPIKALYWSAVLNGVIAVPLMTVLMMMAADPRVMGQFTVPPILKGVGWIATGVMAAAVIAMFATWIW